MEQTSAATCFSQTASHAASAPSPPTCSAPSASASNASTSAEMRAQSPVNFLCLLHSAVILAVPGMFERRQVRPVLFTRQRISHRFTLRLRQKHSTQVVAAIYRIESVFRSRELVINYLEERMRG